MNMGGVEIKTILIVLNQDEQENIYVNICKKLNLHLNMFHPDLDAILLSYKNIQYSEPQKTTHLSPVYLQVTAKFYLFQPEKGQKLVCTVAKVEKTFIECIALGKFSISVHVNMEGLKVGMAVLVEIISVSMVKMFPIMMGRLVKKALDKEDYSPSCNCGPECSESGPYYTQLGHASSEAELRHVLEARFRVEELVLRMEEVRFSGIKGITKEGCPLANWVLCRTCPVERFLCIWKKRPGHKCKYAVVVISIVCWDAVDKQLAGQAYLQLASKMSEFGRETTRVCETNAMKDCKCQGEGELKGASYTFGCSYSNRHGGCKFAQRKKGPPRKFKMMRKQMAHHVEDSLTDIADQVASHHQLISPDSFANMERFSDVATDCRLGRVPGKRPYSGVTVVMDYSAHSHKDINNMDGGTTAIVTLRRPESMKKEDEQLHVLSKYVPAGVQEEVGGVGVALTHGSLCLEVAREEMHATTAVKFPNKRNPCRIGLVFYQHKKLNLRNHGMFEEIVKEQQRGKVNFGVKVQKVQRQLCKRTEERVVKACNQCDYESMDKRTLKKHVKYVHGKVVTYSCDKCNFRSTWTKCILRHIKSVHENITYPCLKCNYTTKWKANLVRHMKSNHE